MEQKKISLKNLYLIAVISIGLIGLGVGSTFAMFTASAEINNPISLTYNVDYTYDVLETLELTIEPGQTKSATLNINNNTSNSLTYVIWYIGEEQNADFGIQNSNGNNISHGTLSPSATETYTVSVRNKGSSTITITIGVSSSEERIILDNDMKMIPEKVLTEPLMNIGFSINLPSFYSARNYSSYSGTTWEEWVNSDFNYDDYYISRYDTVRSSDNTGGWDLCIDGKYTVLPSDIIINNGEYTFCE